VTAPPIAHADGASGLRGLGRALVLFAPQVALAPVLFFVGVTFLHEAAHAAAALALGGTVTEFAFLPSGNNLGHVRWLPPAGAPGWLAGLVSVAPYAMWSLLASGTALLAARRVRLNRWLAAAIFFWGYVVPLGDTTAIWPWEAPTGCSCRGWGRWLCWARTRLASLSSDGCSASAPWALWGTWRRPSSSASPRAWPRDWVC
jgi:hypothetical protein